MDTDLELRGAREIGTLCGLSEAENIEFLAKASRFKYIAEDAEEHVRIRQEFIQQLTEELGPVLRWVNMILEELYKITGYKTCLRCNKVKDGTKFRSCCKLCRPCCSC